MPTTPRPHPLPPPRSLFPLRPLEAEPPAPPRALPLREHIRLPPNLNLSSANLPSPTVTTARRPLSTATSTRALRAMSLLQAPAPSVQASSSPKHQKTARLCAKALHPRH
ncbi:hypothetical protein KCU93_g89, partial [Aureobasidium melanogenum]